MNRPKLEEGVGGKVFRHREEVSIGPGVLFQHWRDNMAGTLSSRWRTETKEDGEMKALWTTCRIVMSFSITKTLGRRWHQDLHFRKIPLSALAGVTQWIESQPAKQRITGSILSQGTCLGCGPDPWLGPCERQVTYVSLIHRCFSPSVSPSLPL